jgi:YD repeat-containing protein
MEVTFSSWSTYAKNGIDLTRAWQKTANGGDTLIEMRWNAQHRPVTVKDAAGQIMELAWNESGQLLHIAEAQGGNGKEFRYDKQGRLAQVIGPQGKVQAQYTHDKAGNLASETDSEGYTLQHAYDALNRRTKTSYPDGTATEYIWNKLDLVRIRNRHGKSVEYQYDAARQPIPLDDLFAALANFDFHFVTQGTVERLPDVNGKPRYKVTLDKVGIYVKDSYDFNDDSTSLNPKTWVSQPLGYWDCAEMDAGKTPGLGGLLR